MKPSVESTRCCARSNDDGTLAIEVASLHRPSVLILLSGSVQGSVRPGCLSQRPTALTYDLSEPIRDDVELLAGVAQRCLVRATPQRTVQFVGATQ